MDYLCILIKTIHLSRSRWLELIFAFVLLLSIALTSLKPLPAGEGSVGVASSVLDIGDRPFYINDSDPFSSKKGNITFSPSPLYPKILESVSFVSINIFGSNTTSPIWNTILISLSSVAAVVVNRLIYSSGRILAGDRCGLVSMCLYMLCPLTYLYTLSGGITIFVLLGNALVCNGVLQIVHINNTCVSDKKLWHSSFVLLLGLLMLSFLRPSSLFVVLVIVPYIFYLFSTGFAWLRPIVRITLLTSLVFVAILALDQLISSMSYSQMAVKGFLSEPGLFFGFPRDLLRDKINLLIDSPSVFEKIKGFVAYVLWKFMDFVSGMADIRDTHSATKFSSLFPFLLRIYNGFLYMYPLLICSFLSVLLARKLLNSSGLIVLMVSSLVAISPSLMGVAMSRYLYMFFTPFILSASLVIIGLIKFKLSAPNSD